MNDNFIPQIFSYEPFWNSYTIEKKLNTSSYPYTFTITDNNGCLCIMKAMYVNFSNIPSDNNYMDFITSKIKNIVHNPNIINYSDITIYNNATHKCFDVIMKFDFQYCVGSLLSGQYKFNDNEVAKFLMDTTSALLSAHQQNILHKRLNIWNIFSTSNGDYKIGEFGIWEFTDKNMILYTAPEVTNNSFTVQSDIYSLGIIAYQLMNTRKNLPINKQNLVPIEDANPELMRIVLKACASDTSKRYSDISELISDINKLNIPPSNKILSALKANPHSTNTDNKSIVSNFLKKTPNLNNQQNQNKPIQSPPPVITAPIQKKQISQTQSPPPVNYNNNTVSKPKKSKTMIIPFIIVLIVALIIINVNKPEKNNINTSANISVTTTTKSDIITETKNFQINADDNTTSTVPFEIKLPDNAFGIFNFTLYLDDTPIMQQYDINPDNVNTVIFNIENSGIKNATVEVINQDNNMTAVFGTYTIDFDNLSFSTVEEKSSEAFETIDGVVKEAPAKHYGVSSSALKWDDAKNDAEQKGYQLATFTNEEEWLNMLETAKNSGLKYLWIGGKTSINYDTNSLYAYWYNDDNSSLLCNYDSEIWFYNSNNNIKEPSGYDVQKDGTIIEEPYLMLWNVQDKWALCDNSDYAYEIYQGKGLGYIYMYFE